MNFKQIKALSALPPGVLNWRLFVFWRDKNIAFHRQVLFHRMSHIGLFKFLAIFILSTLTWYFYFGWVFFFRTFRFRSRWVLPEGLKVIKQLYDLFCLTFLFSVPPHNYYSLRLHSVKKRDWLQFVFDHESPKWQHYLSLNASAFEKKYLASKHFFSLQNECHSINSIPTYYLINKGEKILWSKIFNKKSRFIKPDGLSQSKGCYELLFHENNTYSLRSKESNVILNDLELIKRSIASEAKKSDLIIQPLLICNKNLAKLLKCDGLITLRIITVIRNREVEIVSSLVFLPKKNKVRIAKILRVDNSSGKMANTFIYDGIYHCTKEDTKWLNECHSIIIPFWDDIKLLCVRAHKLCPHMYSVGWDLAIEEEGPVLIEGNNGFSLLHHQMDGLLNFKDLIKN